MYGISLHLITQNIGQNREKNVKKKILWGLSSVKIFVILELKHLVKRLSKYKLLFIKQPKKNRLIH